MIYLWAEANDRWGDEESETEKRATDLGSKQSGVKLVRSCSLLVEEGEGEGEGVPATQSAPLSVLDGSLCADQV